MIRFKGEEFVEGFGQTKRDRLYNPKGRVVLFQPLDKADSLLWHVHKLFESHFDRLECVCVCWGNGVVGGNLPGGHGT